MNAWACALLGGFLWAGTADASSLDAATQKRVRGATFEVVVPKPPEDSVRYERAPPFELLPFAERNDKFLPIGTAFAIGEGQFVTAAHVLAGALGGQGGLPVLRDSAGNTHAIGQVLKFSGHQDFAVFSASLQPAAILDPAPAAELDEQVFAVGNALGEGVVIRGGLLTSLTPEAQDGRWKWLRFSAATSPGNSGGPLLNANGQVLGVVIGKSESENLNYALPIEHVRGAASAARVEQRFPMRVPVLRDAIVANLNISIPLPLPLPEFAVRFLGEQRRAFGAERARLLAEKAGELPPGGRSDELLGSVEWAVCPLLVMQTQEREWKPDADSRNTVELAKGGEVCVREAGGLGLFSLDAGKAMDGSLHADRRRAMDLLLEGLKLPRYFGEDPVVVTSLGAPARESEHRDRYGRLWTVTSFALPYGDSYIVVAWLPTPEGFAGMLTFATRGLVDLMTDHMMVASDFFYVTFHGTLVQWQAFLTGPHRPPALAGVKLTRDAQGLHYRSKRIDLDVPPSLLELDDSSTVQLRMSYSRTGNAVVWDVGAIHVSNEKQSPRFFSLARQPKPAEGAPKALVDRWSDMLESRGDFSPGRGHDAEYKKFWRRAAISADFRPGSEVDRNATLLYAVTSTVEGARVPREIDDMHDLLLENVRVKER